MMDDEHILYRKNSFINKFTTISGFYFLIVAAQPLLLGAVFKGLLGSKVSFNRTPKEKKPTDKGLQSIKRRYLIYSGVIFFIGLILFIISFQIPLSDPRSTTLIIGAYAGVVPLVLSLLWYWKLEEYLDQVGEITAVDVLEKEALNFSRN
jgi:hypothetical protein